ncbi:MAG: type II 3-dehydroquinate dehydratase [Saccharofermentanales bacterium]|jgi:3-dehydroquinate dehydratase-2
MKILVLNGPNLNMLGIREPDQYGSETYTNLVNLINEHCSKKNYEVLILQSNHEGDLIDKIQDAYFEKIDGIVFNPGGYTHTSIALLDAIKAVSIPTVEVHISKIEEREAYRQISYIREACITTISGKGINGYIEAIDFLAELIKYSGD